MASGFRDSGISPILSMIADYRDRSERADVRQYNRDRQDRLDGIAAEDRSRLYSRQDRLDGIAAEDRSRLYSRQERLDGIAAEDRSRLHSRQDRQDAIDSNERDYVAGERDYVAGERDRVAKERERIQAGRQGLADSVLSEAQTSLSDAGVAVIKASEAQSLRHPDSPNTLVGDVNIVDNGDGTSTPMVNTDGGVQIPYTVDATQPPSETNPVIKVPSEKVPIMMQHISDTSQAAKDAGVDLSTTQMMVAGFNVQPDGSVSSASPEEFTQRLAGMPTQAAKTSKVGNASDPTDFVTPQLSNSVDALSTVDAASSFNPGGGGLVGAIGNVAPKVADVVLETALPQPRRFYKEFLTPTGHFLFGTPALKTAAKSGAEVTKDSNGAAKVRVTPSKLKLEKASPVLEASRAHNLQVGIDTRVLRNAQAKLDKARGKVQKLAAYAEAFAAGDPNITLEMMQNIQATGDPTTSSRDLVTQGQTDNGFAADIKLKAQRGALMKSQTAKFLAASGPTAQAAAKEKVSQTFRKIIESQADDVALVAADGNRDRAKLLASRLKIAIPQTVAAMNLDPAKMGDLKYQQTFAIAMQSYLRYDGDYAPPSFTPFFNEAVGKARTKVANGIMKVHSALGSSVGEKDVLDYFNALIKQVGVSDPTGDQVDMMVTSAQAHFQNQLKK